MGLLSKIKVAVAVLMPIVLGMSGCCVYIAASIPFKGNMSAYIEVTIYLLRYLMFLFSIAAPVAACSIAYIFHLTRGARLKAEIIFSFLLFFALLVIVPDIVLQVLRRI